MVAPVISKDKIRYCRASNEDIGEITKYRDAVFNEGCAAICNHNIFKHFTPSERIDMVALMGDFAKILGSKIKDLNS